MARGRTSASSEIVAALEQAAFSMNSCNAHAQMCRLASFPGLSGERGFPLSPERPGNEAKPLSPERPGNEASCRHAIVQ